MGQVCKSVDDALGWIGVMLQSTRPFRGVRIPVIDQASAAGAERFLEAASPTAPFEAGARENGNVTLLWERGAREFDIEFLSEYVARVLFNSGERGRASEWWVDLGDASMVSRALELLRDVEHGDDALAREAPGEEG